ncbi:MAG: hypothetical protein AB7V55_08525 [Oscillospiraceae bacterium]
MHFFSLPGLKRSAALCLSALAAISFLSFSTPPGAAEVAEAELVTQGVAVTHSGGQGTAVLLDQNRSTYLTFAGGDTLTIESEGRFSSLYLIWDRPPQPWALDADGATSQNGQNGYLHELVTLKSLTSTATVTLGEGEYTLCDIYLFTDGILPDWVQQWQPILEKADLLALPTHADDEHLFFGGILPTYAGQLGLDVQVVYMTNHWGERYRPHELLDGLWTVGVTAYPLIGPFPDLYASKESLAAAEQTYTREAVLEFQVEVLRRFKPAVVVGHDLAGEYGHGAHMLNAATLLDALEPAADITQYTDSAATYGAWDVPKTYLHLYAENEVVFNWDTPLSRFGGATAYEMAVAGFAKHTSQQEYFSVQQSGTWQDCRKFGLVRSTVGPDVAKDDLFENIEAAQPPPAAESDAPASDISGPEPEASSAALSTPPGTSQAAAASMPAVSSPPDVSPDQSPNATLLLTLVILGAVLVILVLCIVLLRLIRRSKPRGGKRR